MPIAIVLHPVLRARCVVVVFSPSAEDALLAENNTFDDDQQQATWSGSRFFKKWQVGRFAIDSKLSLYLAELIFVCSSILSIHSLY